MKVLLIDSQEDCATPVEQMLSAIGEPVAFQRAGTLGHGIDGAIAWRPDVILADLTLPDSCGVQTLNRLRQFAGAAPIIVLAQNDEQELALQAISHGAQDCLVKGDFDARALARAMRYAIERKKTEPALERRRQAALHEITVATMSARDSRATLNAIASTVRDLLPDLAITIWTRLNDADEWEAVACSGAAEQSWRPFWRGAPFGLITAVVDADKPLLVDNPADDPRASEICRLRQRNFRSFLGVPMRYRDQLLGVASFFSTDLIPFNDEEIEFLTTVTGQIATAVHRVRAHERAQLQAASLADAGRELRAAEIKYGDLLETTHAVVWEIDPMRWQFIFVSAMAEKIFGFPARRWLEDFEFWVHLIHPDERSATVDCWRKTYAEGKDQELEYRVVAADGRIVWLREIVRVIADETGKPARLRGIMVDISAVKTADETLQKHYREIHSLQVINQKILDTDDVRAAIETILDITLTLSGVDAAIVRLLGPAGDLEYFASRGYENPQAIRYIQQSLRAERPADTEPTQPRLAAAGQTQSFVASPLDSAGRAEGFDQADLERIRSSVVVPIVAKAEVLGTLQIGTRCQARFEPDQVNLLESFGSKIGIVVQKAKLYEEIRKHLAHIESLHQFERQILSTLSLDDVLKVLLDKIESLYPFSVAIVIRLIKTDGGGCDVVSCRNIAARSWTEERNGDSFMHGSRPVQAVLQSSAPLRISRPEDDPRLGDREFFRREKLTSYLGIPLRVGDTPVGSLDIMTRAEHHLTEQDVGYLTSLASHAAIAIQNARLYAELGKKSQELSALFAVTAAATESLEMDRILHEVIQKVTEIFGFDATRVFLFDEQQEALHVRASYETHPDFAARTTVFKKTQGITGKVGATGEAIIFSNVDADPAYARLSLAKISRVSDHKFLAGFPLKYKDATLGVMMCMGQKPRQLMSYEIQLINSMLSQIAIALHNARLYSEVEKQSKELSALFDVTAAVSQSLDMEHVLRETVQKITEIFGFDATRAFLFDEQGEELHLMASFAAHAEFAAGPQSFKRGEGITGTVGVTGEAIIVNDPQTAAFNKNPLGHMPAFSEQGRHPHNFLAAFPIKYKQHTLGVILCVGRFAHRLTVHEILLITAMSRQIAIAIHNARLYAEVEKHAKEISALFDVTSAASQSLETAHILREVAQKITEIFAFDAAKILLFDEAKEELRAAAIYHARPTSATGARILRKGQGISGAVASTGKPIILSNIDTDPRYAKLTHTRTARQTQQKFLAAFPIKYQDEILGVITCTGRQPRQLAVHEVQLITSMSSQIAVAIQNARYYEQSKKQAVQLRHYAMRQETVLEQERTRISREIHDELGQALTALKLEISLAGAKLPAGAAAFKSRIGEFAALLDGTIHSVRKIATQLRPDILDKLGLIPAIEWQLQEFRKRTGIRYSFTSRPTNLQLGEDQATALFRIFQEALTNVARHARASRVKARLEARDDEVTLRIEDDGLGIGGEKIVDFNALGLLGMQERAAALGGSVTISRNQPKGTMVSVTLPIQVSPSASTAVNLEETL